MEEIQVQNLWNGEKSSELAPVKIRLANGSRVEVYFWAGKFKAFFLQAQMEWI